MAQILDLCIYEVFLTDRDKLLELLSSIFKCFPELDCAAVYIESIWQFLHDFFPFSVKAPQNILPLIC